MFKNYETPSWGVRAGVALRSGPFPVLCLGVEALQARLVLRTLPHGPLWKLVTPCEPSHGQNKELEWLPSIQKKKKEKKNYETN